MPDKDITPGMHVLITGNHYNDGDLTVAEDELEHDKLLTGIVIEPADYDEEWGQKWKVQVGEGPPPNVLSEQDLSPIPRINMDPTERGFELG
jgi:S-adenosylmethionine/arginine decarboxylase-like enzyme